MELSNVSTEHRRVTEGVQTAISAFQTACPDDVDFAVLARIGVGKTITAANCGAGTIALLTDALNYLSRTGHGCGDETDSEIKTRVAGGVLAAVKALQMTLPKNVDYAVVARTGGDNTITFTAGPTVCLIDDAAKAFKDATFMPGDDNEH